VGAVLVHRTMSLDGFVAGREHEMDWIFEHPAGEGWEEIMEATGAIISPGSGRVDLELVDAQPLPGVTTLRYRVRR